jgi:hypothetical protein
MPIRHQDRSIESRFPPPTLSGAVSHRRADDGEFTVSLDVNREPANKFRD